MLTGFGPTPGLIPESNKTPLGKEQIYQAYTLKYNLKTFLRFLLALKGISLLNTLQNQLDSSFFASVITVSEGI